MTKRKEGKGARVWTMQTVRDRCDEVGSCMIWKLSVNSTGYPSVSMNGTTITVRKLVYVNLMGKEMKSGRRITSRCHNPLCCSETCLIQSRNTDILKAAHERRRKADPMSLRREQRASSKAKLSPEIAADIRSSDEDGQTLAKRHGVALDTIRAVRRNATYKEPVMAATSVFDWRPA